MKTKSSKKMTTSTSKKDWKQEVEWVKQKEKTKNERRKSWNIDLLIYQKIYRSNLYSFRLLCINIQV